MPNLKPLDNWFLSEKRDLPWRQDPTPYKVWISEVMLQQTQVKTVIPYFEKWIDRFPSITELAEASIEDVIKLWEGLGYYSRARNIHESARNLIQHGHKVITQESLSLMKGIGPYTKGAILSFAFKERASAVDGNVQRVMARLLGFKEEISKASSKKFIEDSVFKSLSHEKPWHTMEALIELGALVCQKKAQCHMCPMAFECQGLKLGIHTSLPVKKERPPQTKIQRTVLLIQTGQEILVKKGEKGKIMQDLYEFPWIEGKTLTVEFGTLKVHLKKSLFKGEVKHSFTRYAATLFPYEIKLSQKVILEGYTWIEKSKIRELPFSSGHRKILELIEA